MAALESTERHFKFKDIALNFFKRRSPEQMRKEEKAIREEREILRCQRGESLMPPDHPQIFQHTTEDPKPK